MDLIAYSDSLNSFFCSSGEDCNAGGVVRWLERGVLPAYSAGFDNPEGGAATGSRAQDTRGVLYSMSMASY